MSLPLPKEKYTLPYIYIPRKGKRGGPDLTKQWLVRYSFLNPETGKMQPIKESADINKHQTIELRTAAAETLRKAIESLLKFDGFNPFSKENELRTESKKLATCVELYLASLPGKVVKSTISIRKSRLGNLVEYAERVFGANCMISQIKGATITDLLEELMETEEIKTGKTHNLYKGDYSTFFNHFLNKEDQTLLKNNPAKFVESKPEIKNANRPYTDKEFKAILDYTAEHLPYMNLMFRFLYYTCMRPRKEARMIQVKDILIDKRNRDNSRIRIRHSKTARYTGGDQYIPLDPILYKILVDEVQVLEYDPEFFIFTTARVPGPEPISSNYWNDHIVKLRKAGLMSIDQTMYSTKHTRCCNLFEDGESMAKIIQLTRHIDFASLQDYLKGMGYAMDDNPVYKSREF